MKTQAPSIKKNAKQVKDEPFVSVLTPVYNGDEFLRECIESVLNQNYDNWEYVLVNNQSTDRSLEIMEEYAAQDSRIRIHNNEEFLPLMENMNHAFRQISPHSKYCKVVHADDFIFENCLKEMVAIGEEYPSVGIVSAYRLDDKKVDLDGLSYPSNFISGKKVARKYLLEGNSKFGAPTSLLIRSDLIRKREKVYDESYLRADSGACLEFLKESDFGFVHQVLTFTRRHEMSITNTQAKPSNAYIHGELKFHLKYGPYYLSEEEQQARMTNRLNVYYILLARNLVEKRSIKVFKEQVKILESLGLELEIGRLIKKIIRELFLQLFKKLGFQFKKTQ